MFQPVGIRSLAVSFPNEIRTNDYYQEHYPEVFAKAEEKSLAKTFSLEKSTPKSIEFDREMMPYLSDPFRGTIERRVLAPGETSLTLECKAAADALQAAKLSSNEVDLIVVSSLLPENYMHPGNAVYLAQELGIKAPAWNLESMCASALVAFEVACSLVQSQKYRNVLVVASTTYSRLVKPNHTLSWFLGDAAAAFVVGSLKENQGIVASQVVNTAGTCGAFSLDMMVDEQGNPYVNMKAKEGGGKQLRSTATDYIRTCCHGAAAKAGISLDQIDFFAVNTPLAWFASLFTKTLGIDPNRTLNLFPQYGNIGAVLPLANLYHAALSGKIHENSLILVYSIGSASTTGATIMRWGDVALGPAPAPSPTSVREVAVAV
ncbi:3-oxoacyl-ACP synthase III family protein [Roseofilum casamattae]|uniref:3-oxoacyl-[acyl-carrier-protein] synthase III C-terminal domain-containing protein n=1 Tax=Roseofilum casamattae BLCC-M143 TaxID=3022442 RepID=A0ABT7BT04_9CYAN|nr:3-oxoacyl-[acyl-carrier-protein] synthase III C-terminal domain-containing protein [Roseofilum casamattae]MDJ1182306.1 3-oxoacyl-[acyl-carrier-protein] synthase III C-terminal domain-containing protein [Roseofilum casamattae BLCC-M143]